MLSQRPRFLILVALGLAFALGAWWGLRRAPPASSSPAGAPVAVSLVGQRALLGETPLFDAERPPVFRVDGDAAGAWAVTVRGREDERRQDLVARPLPGGALLRPAGVLDLGLDLRSGPVEIALLRAGEAVRRWPARWGTPPGRIPALAHVATLRKAGRLAEARAALESLPDDPEVQLWAPDEAARLVAAGGDPDATIEAWVDGARRALADGAPSEAGRRIRAAAYFAIRARHFGRAADLLDEATRLQAGLHDAAGETRVLYYRSLLAQALGDYRRALDGLERVARASTARGDDAFALGAGDLRAQVLLDLGLHVDAVALLDDLRGPMLASPDPAVRIAWRINYAWSLLRAMAEGAIRRDYPRVRTLLRAAREAAQREGLTAYEPDVLANLAWAAFLEGQDVEARAWLVTARGARPAGSAGPADHFLDLLDAEIELKASHLDAAAARLRAVAVAAADEAGGRPTESGWRAAYGLGRVERAWGHPDLAWGHFSRALTQLEAAGRTTPLRRGRSPFFAGRRGLLDDALDLLLGEGRVEEAFSVADAARARVLRGVTAQVRVSRLDAAQRRRWAGLIEAFERARDAHLAERAHAGPMAGAARRAWVVRVEKLRVAQARAFDAAQAWLEESSPAPARSGARAAQVRAALGPGEALLELAPHRDGHVAFWIDAEGTRSASIAAGGDVVGPWAARLPGLAHLYVVAGGWTDAFDLSRRLIDTSATVSFLPHAHFLADAIPAPTGAALIVADPLSDLPFARRDAAAVAERVPGARALIGPGATLAAVLDGLRDAPLFHFSGHGVLRPRSPWDAHLKLAGGETLGLADILTRRLAGALVVLNGCRTGVPDVLAREDVVGLPEAFLAAGARGVIAADRDLPDEDAHRFIARFYAAGGAEHPATALRQAARELRAAGSDVGLAYRLVGRR